MILAIAFFAVALAYSSVGFGGGSTYNALLVLASEDIAEVPIVALACNIAVVSIGSWRFSRAGHVDWRRIWPLILFSVPAAFVGGYLLIERGLLIGLLGVSLAFAGAAMLVRPQMDAPRTTPPSRVFDMAIGGGLGLLAGITGIGGGIFLAPLLYLRRWGRAQLIGGTAAVFILLNSIAGLAGQMSKSGIEVVGDAIVDHRWLFPAVILGGLVGSRVGAQYLSRWHLRVLTALLVLYVAGRLLFRLAAEQGLI